MPSSPDQARPSPGAILLHASVYALLIAALVIFWPEDPRVFIYGGF